MTVFVNQTKTEKIEILRAQLAATQRELAAALARGNGLREAAKSLRNEISGALGIAAPELRASIGDTNMACLTRRINELDAALATPAVPVGEGEK